MFGARRVARRTARRTARRVARRRIPAPAPAPTATPTGAPAAAPPVNYVLLAGEGSSPPIKLTQQDAQRIQEAEGMPPEQLEDNDLKESMQELNIHAQPLTPQDYAALGMQPPPQAAGQAGSTTTVVRQPAAPATQPSMEQQLQNLDSLRQKGLITEDDYNAKKRQILGI